jgi:hypothetical protein
MTSYRKLSMILYSAMLLAVWAWGLPGTAQTKKPPVATAKEVSHMQIAYFGAG